jgi:hypothetical protein
MDNTGYSKVMGIGNESGAEVTGHRSQVRWQIAEVKSVWAAGKK